MDLKTPIVIQQLPEFIVSEFPLFVDFLQAYYEFQSQYSYNIAETRESGTTDNAFVEFLKQEYANKFPDALIDDRDLISAIHEIYKTKGTFESVELLFRLFFNESVEVFEPSKQILRPSDGVWQQNSYIRIEITDGSLEGIKNCDVRIENDYGTFVLYSEDIVYVNPNTVHVFFKTNSYVQFDPAEKIVFHTETGEYLAEGYMKPAPSRIRIIDGGKFWQTGQVILIPGTYKYTVVRVTETDSDCVILKTEVVEYGYDHSQYQSVQVSPFPNKPAITPYDISTSLISVHPDVFEHTINIRDNIDSIDENVAGYLVAIDPRMYFLQDYCSEDYVAFPVFNTSFSQSYTLPTELIGLGLSYEDWLDSRAFIAFEEDLYVRTPGKWLNDRGQLSNDFIRLQDSFYYQIFSYVIKSSVDINQFKPILDLIHPAGLKYFSLLSKTAEFDLRNYFDVYRVFSDEYVYIHDVAETSDDNDKSVIKPLTDITTPEDDYDLIFTKVLEDEFETHDDSYDYYEYYDSEDYFLDDYVQSHYMRYQFYIDFIKASFSDLIVSDTIGISQSKNISDIIIPDDDPYLNDEAYLDPDYIDSGYIDDSYYEVQFFFNLDKDVGNDNVSISDASGKTQTFTIDDSVTFTDNSDKDINLDIDDSIVLEDTQFKTF